MYPRIAEHYGEILFLTCIVGAGIFLHGARRERLPIARVVLLLLGMTAAAHVGGRFHLLAENGRLFDLASWSDLAGGYRQPGALVALAAAVAVLPRLLLPRVSIALIGDLVAPAIAFSLVVARFGCLAVGCCFGTPSQLPWAITFPPRSRASMMQFVAGLLPSPALPSLAVHPLEVYFLLLSLGVGVVLVRRQRRKAYDGEILLLFLALHESGKFLLEFLRFTPPNRPSAMLIPAASLVLATVGIVGLSAHRLRRRSARAAARANAH